MAGFTATSGAVQSSDTTHDREPKSQLSPPLSNNTQPTSASPGLYPDTHDHGSDEVSLPSLSKVSANLHAKIQSFLAESHDSSSLLYRVQQQTRTSLSVVREALSRYKLRELSLSYNGGKDCLVLLILFLASLHPLPEPSGSIKQSVHSHGIDGCNNDDTQTTAPGITEDGESGCQYQSDPDSEPPISIPAMYARPSHPFPAVEAFVDSSSRIYHLSLTRYTTSPPHPTLRDTFASYLQKYPGIRAIFVGTRRTDPHGQNLTHFDRTDHGWPDFMRIHPVIDWHYVEIWAFIRHLGVEYCPLYDQGYTSLGGTNDTHPNPMLQIERDGLAGAGQNGNISSQNTNFRPAYELVEDGEERLGRY